MNLHRRLVNGTLEGVTTVPKGSRISQPAPGILNVTAATQILNAKDHSGRTIALNRAAGIAVTLPPATGSGAIYKFVVVTTVTSNSNTIKVANASDTMCGNCVTLQDAGDTMVGFEAGATADTITGNGTTTGGLKGDVWIVEDVAANLYHVIGRVAATGSEATPFSATVA